MRIKNNTSGHIIIGDLPNSQGGFGVSLPAQVEILIFNEDAEKSVQLGSFLTSGVVLNLGTEEPSTGEPQAGAQPAAVGGFPVSVTNQPDAGKALVATSTTTAEWQATAGTITFIDGEVPSGVVNGVNLVFTLANVPAAGSLHLYAGGLRQSITIDYSLVGSNITFFVAPNAPAKIVADYRL